MRALLLSVRVLDRQAAGEHGDDHENQTGDDRAAPAIESQVLREKVSQGLQLYSRDQPKSEDQQDGAQSKGAQGEGGDGDGEGPADESQQEGVGDSGGPEGAAEVRPRNHGQDIDEEEGGEDHSKSEFRKHFATSAAMPRG